MATFAPSSGTIRFSEIRSAFGLTTVSFSERRGKIFWRANAFRGVFPASTIKISNFYGTGGTSPVTPSTTFYSANNGTTQGATVTQSVTIPLYYELVVELLGAGGGGGGGGGATFNFNGTLQSLGNGSSGASGGNSTFGVFASASGGGGGGGSANPTPGANGPGANGNAPGGPGGASGWAGVSAGANGGSGGYTWTKFLSPANGGSGPSPGTVITLTVGAGGLGGGGYGNGGAGGPGRYGEAAVYVS